ncbi:MAG TPA: baseplate J/gp47 family protein [Terriglobia bacterium]|nr:baseplate J/gp47 family protein [Terriglobia bacterium]
MNPATANLIDRPYLEVVDDILTAVTGGVVKEPIFYDVKEDLYVLSRRASDIRSISGTQDQKHQTFQKEIDYVFSEGDNAVVWQKGGHGPDDDTTFYVNYFPASQSLSPLTDINVGSVTRTLSEAVGREIATVFQEVNAAYLAGFIDTAKGQSLELVVSILDVTRKTKEFARGLVTFFRDPAAADGNITIPEGTLLSTTKGEAEFVTTQPRTLQRGQPRIDVPVRAGDDFKGSKGVQPAGAITTLQQAITGITRVTNFDATVLGADDESDDDLRLRAKAKLQGLDKATLAALTRVVFEERAVLTEIWDPNGAPGKQSDPGNVVLLVQSSPERFESLRSAVNETRAAGVLTALVAKYVFFKLRMVISISSGLTAAGKMKVVGEVIASVQQYTDGLDAGKPASGADIIKAIVKDVKEVGDPKNIKVVDVLTWRADIGKPGAQALVDLILQAVQSAPAGNSDAVRAAVTTVISDAAPGPPSERRIADRSLVQGPGGQRATDQEIEAGTFQVVAKVNGEDWTVALDLTPDDILLVER